MRRHDNCIQNGQHGWLAQKQIPFIGTFRQLMGGAMTWVTFLIFAFSMLAAWDTGTVKEIRDDLPWLNLVTFIAVTVAALIVAMIVEHKWIQPSVMAYWNQMFYNHGNPIVTDQKRIEEKIDRITKMLEQRKETVIESDNTDRRLGGSSPAGPGADS